VVCCAQLEEALALDAVRVVALGLRAAMNIPENGAHREPPFQRDRDRLGKGQHVMGELKSTRGVRCKMAPMAWSHGSIIINALKQV